MVHIVVIEIARDIAGIINAHYRKPLLVLPEAAFDENVAVVPGIDGRKMSKSYGNVIPLFEDDKAIKKAIFSIKTDSRPMEEPKNPEEILVYEIYKPIATPDGEIKIKMTATTVTVKSDGGRGKLIIGNNSYDIKENEEIKIEY